MRVADADILILPGLGDSGPDHWQSRWRQRLSTARKVDQSDWVRPQRDAWIETIGQAIAASARPVVVVAHSLGVTAFLHAAEQVDTRVAGAFLVAPPSEAFVLAAEGVDPAFVPYRRARLPFSAALVAANDDPLAEAGFASALAADIGAEFLDAGAAGHINAASGHGPWPEGSLAFAHFLAKL